MNPNARGLSLVTVFGLGLLRPAPGTWGSLPPVALAWAMVLLGVGPTHHHSAYYTVLTAVFLIFGVACIAQGDRAEARFGRKDPSQVVADETCAQALTVLALPPSACSTPLAATISLAVAFLTFRLFDILKPWPARGLQRIPGGWGILIDDLIAGLYAGTVTNAAWFFWLRPALAL